MSEEYHVLKSIKIKEQPNSETSVLAHIIDDDRVGEAAWSSKNLVDKLCPPLQETGRIVKCYPVEGYPLDVEWETKNLLNITVASQTRSGVTFTINADKTITVNGTATATIWFTCGTAMSMSGVEYMISGCPSGGNGAQYCLYPGSYTSIMDIGGGKKLTPTSTAESSIIFYVAKGITFNNAVLKPMVRKADTDSTYEPYAETATITRCGKNLAKPKSVKNETITGITVEIQDDGTFILNGTAQVDYANGYLTNYLLNSHGNRNKYPPGTYFLKVRELGGSVTNGYAQAAINAPSGTQYLAFTNSTLKVVLTEASEVSVFIQFRTNTGVAKADNYHISVQMELGSTATDYEPYNAETFNPGETIPALPGVNTIFADVGLVTVSGRADPIVIIEDLTNAILSLGGNI